MKVNGKHCRTIWPDGDDPSKIHIIDQRQLPHAFVIETLTDSRQVCTAIKDMHVRGAGLIGASAAFAMYLAARRAPSTHFIDHMQQASKEISATRPTARNLNWAIERQLRAITGCKDYDTLCKTTFSVACDIADEDAEYCRRIGEHGLEIIKKISRQKNGNAVNILTHCNAGWLAFVDYGSATAPIYAARDAGIDLHVWVDETRPWNQGAKLTTWELVQEGIDNTLIVDNAGGYLMQKGLVDLVIVGTDRTTHTGDVANKIGTYLKALAACDNDVPFYVALPSSTFDWNLDNGMDIPIEQRAGEEITSISGKDDNSIIRTVQLTADGTKAKNYSFDITPARLISGLITERGVVKAEKQAIHQLFPEGDVSDTNTGNNR